MKYILFFIVIIGLAESTKAHNEPMIPQPHVTTSIHGGAYFIMVPDRSILKSLTNTEKLQAFGKAFKLNLHGESELLWETSGWYASQVFISPDGRYLVRIGNNRQNTPSLAENLSIAFYKDGKEIKRYSRFDSKIDEISKLLHSIRARDVNLAIMSNDYFEVRIPDDSYYIFSLESGEIISSPDSL